MIIKQLSDNDEKKKVTRYVLEALPDWFAVEESREEYINDSSDRPTFVAYDGDKPAGFLCLKETGKETVELAVMGVLMEYHRKGIGLKFLILQRPAQLKKVMSLCR